MKRSLSIKITEFINVIIIFHCPPKNSEREKYD